MQALTLLGFDTTFAHCAASVMRDGQVLGSRREEMKKGQAERLLPLVEDLLSATDQQWADVDALVVGIGPGNFTGIRISISTVRGLALALKVPIIPVSSFELMRGEHSVENMDPQLVSLAAPRGANYLQLFEGGAASGAAYLLQPGAVLPDELQRLRAFTPVGAGGAVGEHWPEIALRELNADPDILVKIAAAKLQAGWDVSERPAPLYVKPPDAAPPKDPAPVLLS